MIRHGQSRVIGQRGNDSGCVYECQPVRMCTALRTASHVPLGLPRLRYVVNAKRDSLHAADVLTSRRKACTAVTRKA
jgi:hypothetical protein